MSAATAAPGCRLQSMLQTAVQGVQWTYSLFWQLCPQQGILVWGDGYYNGAIKTRKTVQPMEVSAEEASLQRSQQLRELYDMLLAGESNQPPRRPSAALSPEDLTESEWFYLMCVSFSFPPGVGLPGKAYAKRQHVWLTGANEVDSKFFSRAILAKSARIQTVVCIPLLDGVVELGTTNKVEEDMGWIQQVKSCFTDRPICSHNPSPKPALSEHSTSNPPTSSGPPRFSSPPLHDNMYPIPADPTAAIEPKPEDDEADDENENENENEDVDEDDEEGGESDSEAHTVAGGRRRQNPAPLPPPPPPHIAVTQGMEMGEPSELMQLEMSEDIRLGSPDDCSNNLDSDFHLLAVTQHVDNTDQLLQQRLPDAGAPYRTGSARMRWPTTSLMHTGPDALLFHQLPASGGGEEGLVEHTLEELTQEDTHYPQTVSTILNHQPTWWSAADNSAAPIHSRKTAFSKWTPQQDHLLPVSVIADETSQWQLKYILFTVPYHHTNTKFRDDPSTSNAASVGAGDCSPAAASRFRRMGGGTTAPTPQEELSANHVLAERRRREKLNERFMILRSLVPFVSKMDKASILGDTIEYVKQLRRKIQDLEGQTRPNDQDPGPAPDQSQRSGVTASDRARTSSGSDRRKMRVVEGSSGKPRVVESPPPPPTPETTVAVTETPVGNSIEVSIIETDALLELQCSYREGLLLDLMQLLRDIRIETTTVQSSLNNGVMVAELRAKVKDNVHGKKTSIVEVKRVINQIIPQ